MVPSSSANPATFKQIHKAASADGLFHFNVLESGTDLFRSLPNSKLIAT
jgi:hypothetical protein